MELLYSQIFKFNRNIKYNYFYFRMRLQEASDSLISLSGDIKKMTASLLIQATTMIQKVTKVVDELEDASRLLWEVSKQVDSVLNIM